MHLILLFFSACTPKTTKIQTRKVINGLSFSLLSIKILSAQQAAPVGYLALLGQPHTLRCINTHTRRTH